MTLGRHFGKHGGTGAGTAFRGSGAAAPRFAALAVLCLALCIGGLFPPAAAGQDLFSSLLDGVEVMIGESVAQSVVEQYGPPVRLTPARQQWVDGIFAAVVAQTRREAMPYTLHILHSDEVNAFAAPGGYVFVTTALLSYVGDDADALANVLGHEVAHVEHKHGMNALVRQLGIGFLLQLVLGGSSNDTLETVTGVAVALLSLGWSREQEHESDDLGQRLAAAAGFSPYGMVRFFEVLQRLEGQEIPFLEFLHTHPLTSDRIARARQRAESLQPAAAARPAAPGGNPVSKTVPAQQDPVQRDASSSAEPADPTQPRSEEPRVFTRGGRRGAGGDPRAALRTDRSGGQLSRIALEDLFTIEVPDTWHIVVQRDSQDDDLVAELKERDSETYLGLYQYAADGGTDAADHTWEWRAWLLDTRDDMESVEPMWERRLDGFPAASFVTRWTEESGERQVLYATAVIAGDDLYHLLFVLPGDDFRERRPLLDHILESWRAARRGAVQQRDQ